MKPDPSRPEALTRYSREQARAIQRQHDRILDDIREGLFELRFTGTFFSEANFRIDEPRSWDVTFLIPEPLDGWDLEETWYPDDWQTIATAKVLIVEDGWDEATVFEAFEDINLDYAEIGRHAGFQDGLSWEDTWFTIVEDEPARMKLLIIDEMTVHERWRGNRLLPPLVSALIASPIARETAVSVIEPVILSADEKARDRAAEAKVIASVEAAGFTRHFDTPIFLRSNTDVPLPDTSKPENPLNHFRSLSASWWGLPTMPSDDGRVSVSLPVPTDPSAWAHQFEGASDWRLSYDALDNALVATRGDDAIASRFEGGAPRIAGEPPFADPALETWLLAVHRDLHLIGDRLPSAARTAAKAIVEDKPIAMVPGEPVFMVIGYTVPEASMVRRFPIGVEADPAPNGELPWSFSMDGRVVAQVEKTGYLAVEAFIDPDLGFDEDEESSALMFLTTSALRMELYSTIADDLLSQAVNYLATKPLA